MPALIALAGLLLAILLIFLAAVGAVFLAILEAAFPAEKKPARRKPSSKVHWEEYSGEELDAFLKGLGR